MTSPAEPSRSPRNPASATPSYVARNPTDLIALVPAVLGFHPQDSVVLLTFGSPGRAFHARVDLPVETAEQEGVVTVLVGAAQTNQVECAAVLLYTDDVEAARAQGRLLLDRLLEVDIAVIDVILVDDGTWYPVLEDDARPTAYDLETHPFTARQVFEGRVVHRDREALADSLVGTDEDDAVAVAIAATRFLDLMAAAVQGPGKRSQPGDFLRDEARWLQRRLRGRLADGLTFAPRDAGRLLVLASFVPTRDVAWAEITRAAAEGHVELWRELVRRAPSDLLPGAAALLAFAAWQDGDGALAWCALDRCLEEDPDYSMAHCVAHMLTAAVPPDAWEGIPESELPVLAT